MKFSLQHRTKFHLFFGFGCIAVLIISSVLSHLGVQEVLAVTITLLTATGGVTGFLYGKHTQDTQLFRELFREFNKRYDKLNAKLNEIRNRPPDHWLDPAADYGILFDYFNLCAEEHMYDSAGFIDPRVWRAWRNGMKDFDQDPEIHEFWKRELEQNSYYGFTLDCLIDEG